LRFFNASAQIAGDPDVRQLGHRQPTRQIQFAAGCGDFSRQRRSSPDQTAQDRIAAHADRSLEQLRATRQDDLLVPDQTAIAADFIFLAPEAFAEFFTCGMATETHHIERDQPGVGIQLEAVFNCHLGAVKKHGFLRQPFEHAA